MFHSYRSHTVHITFINCTYILCRHTCTCRSFTYIVSHRTQIMSRYGEQTQIHPFLYQAVHLPPLQHAADLPSTHLTGNKLLTLGFSAATQRVRGFGEEASIVRRHTVADEGVFEGLVWRYSQVRVPAVRHQRNCQHAHTAPVPPVPPVLVVVLSDRSQALTSLSTRCSFPAAVSLH